MPSKWKITVKSVGKEPSEGCKTLAAVLLLGALAVPAPVIAQQQASGSVHIGEPVVAVTYDLERSKTSASGVGFWLQGGGVDAAVPLYKGLSVAGNFRGDHASNIQPGVNLGQLSYMAGPRYTFGLPHVQVFGEGLFGGVHGFDSLFPAAGGVTNTANSYAMQLGGGLDIALRHGFGLRALEIDYVRTALPNNGTNTQNSLGLAFGLSYHFRTK